MLNSMPRPAPNNTSNTPPIAAATIGMAARDQGLRTGAGAVSGVSLKIKQPLLE